MAASWSFFKVGETASAAFKRLATYLTVDPTTLDQVHIGRSVLNDSDGNEYNTNNPMPTKADGSAGTNITPETGAIGQIGWLSSIHKRLTGTLNVTLTGANTISVSNFPTTQPISAVGLPLPIGAATETTLSNAVTALGTQGSTPPTISGTGIMGYLRGIFDALSGNIKTTSTQTVSGTGKLDGTTVTSLEQLMKTMIAEQRLSNILSAYQASMGDDLDKLRAEILVDLNK